MKNMIDDLSLAEKNLPLVSVLIPTLNAATVLEDCLKSVNNQNYPKGKIEIIIADGGSTDRTLEIAKKYRAKIFQNPLKTAEAGKAVALRQAKGELVALIDSDNILPDKDWFKMMIVPFVDPEIVGSEPWEFSYRKEDGFIDRYCALMGMNDPLCYFLGNYDRRSVLSGKWTGIKLLQEDKGNWLKITLQPPNIPTIGANGTIFHRRFLNKEGLVNDYLFDVDIIAQAALKNPVVFAKVKVGIIHLYCGSDIKKFIRKQKRRVKDYLYFKRSGIRAYPWVRSNRLGLLEFVLSCATIVPLLYQAIRGFFKKKDFAYFFHPLACWITLYIYSISLVRNLINSSTHQMDRSGWKQ